MYWLCQAKHMNVKMLLKSFKYTVILSSIIILISMLLLKEVHPPIHVR